MSQPCPGNQFRFALFAASGYDSVVLLFVVCVHQGGLDFETQPVHYVSVLLVDGELSAVLVVTVHVLDVNEAPNPENVRTSVMDNAAAGTVIVASIPSRDPDTASGSTTTYSIVDGDRCSCFAVDTLTGQIQLTASPTAFEALPREHKYLSLVIGVSDGALSGYAVVHVDVASALLATVLKQWYMSSMMKGRWWGIAYAAWETLDSSTLPLCGRSGGAAKGIDCDGTFVR
jgi:hypothetical protein